MGRQLTDQEALVAARKVPERFAVFYERHADRVLRYFAVRTATAEAAADLMAETFADAFANVHRYRPDAGLPVTWLFAIAHNLLVDYYRRGAVSDRARGKLAMDPLVVGDEDVRRIEDLASSPSVQELLAGLTADERIAVEARVVQERAYEDIAREQDCSAGLVRQRVSRGLARLRAGMEGDH